MQHILFNPSTRAAAAITMLLAAVLFIVPSAGAAGHAVFKLTFTPSTPNVLVDNDHVTVNFSYRTTQPGGVRIFARPLTGGSPSPGYAASGAGISPTGSGTGAQWFTITKGNVTVDGVRIQMWNAAQTTMLFEAILPVHYQFREP